MRYLLALLLFSSVAHAEPWTAYGQTSIGNGVSVDNPTPNSYGVVGAITSLPYQVPYGYRLIIESQAIEGYDSPGISVLFIWIGDSALMQPPAVKAVRALVSVGASNGTTEVRGQWVIDEGYWVHVRLIGGQALYSLAGWSITGRLEPIL